MPHQHHAKHHNHGRDVNLEARNPDATVIQVVTETASKTFDGPIGGYSTVNAPSAAPMTQSSKRVQAPPSSQVQPATQVQPAAQVLPATQATPSTQVQPSTSAQPQPAQPQPQPQPQSAQPQPSTSANSSLAPIAQISATPQTSSQQAATQSSTPSTGAQSVSPSTPSSSTQSKSSVSSQVSSDPVSAIPPSSSVLPTSDTPTPTSSFVAQSATSSASSTSTSIATTRSNGMSGGAKAGLIIGILFGIVALLALVFFCYRRKKQNVNEAYEKHDDEKAQTSFANEGGPVGVNRVPSIQPANQISTAPQLSLRPVTEFSPDLAAQRARINALAAAGGPARTSVNNTANPFGNHAEMSVKSPPSTQPTSPTNPFGNHAEMETPAADESIAPPAQVPAPLRVRTPTPEGAAAIAGGAVAGAGLAATAAGAGAGRQKTPKPLNLSPNRPTRNGADLPMPSPTGTEFSMSSMTPSAVANGPPPSNVHRIQLDFKPSMEDELELCAGQLVRLLHEYDDGWVSTHCYDYVYVAANQLNRRFAYVSTAPSKVSRPVLVSLLDLSSRAPHQVHADLPKAPEYHRQERWAQDSNGHPLRLAVTAHQAPITGLLDQPPQDRLNSSAPCHRDRTAVDLSSVPTFQFPDKRDEAIRRVRSVSGETAPPGRAR